jgi:hypothetical protein
MGTFEDALRERLDAINSIGEAQTTWSRLYNARRREQAANEQSLAQRRAQYGAMTTQQNNANAMQSGFGVSGGSGSGGSEFQRFKNSIGTKESSNNYNARNRDSGAMGRYQIMPANLGGARSGWDYEALGYDVSASQFMKSPEIQEKVATYKLQQYYNKYGAAGAAIAWYAGPGTANKFVNSGQVSKRIQNGGYPSVYAYMQAILNGM